MATDIGIRLGLQGASQVQGGIAAVGAGLGDLDSKAMKAGDAFKKMGGLLLGGLSVGAIGSFLKGAIDAADETFNLSQKVGIAAKDLGGLQLAFKQAGIDSGGMQSALVKLSKNVVDGNAAFGAMGVAVKNTDGSLKSSKQVLSEVADVFQDMPDGIDKTALATQVFGKSGADLIPMLNGGAEGLAEMADMAERLGLVIDDKTAASADQFNDTVELLGMSLQGVGRQVAAEMLPTLTRLAGSLLVSATKGDGLKKVAAILSTALRGLYSVAVGIVEIFNSVGKAIGGTVAAVVAALRGDFASAKQILSESAIDIKAGWSSTAASIANAWEESADGSITSAAAIVGAGGRTVTSVKATATEHAKAAKAAAAYTAEGVKLADSLLAQDQILSSDFRPKLDKLTAAYVAGKLSLSDYEGATQRLIEQQPYWKAAIKDQEQELKLLAADVEELWKWRLKEADEAQKRADSVIDQVSKQLVENESLRHTKGELALLVAQRLDEQIAIAAATVTRDESLGSCTRETEAHKATLQALLDLKSARDDGVVLAAANEASIAWQQTAKEVGQGLTDSLFRAFEAGAGFFSTLWSGIKNLFKTTVLKMIIQPVQTGINGMVGSALGMGGTAANAANGSSPLSSALSILAMGKSAFSAGAALTGFTGAGTGMALQGAGSMMANGSIVQGAAQGLGALAPWAAGGAVGIYGGRAISNGYSAVGSSGNTLVNVGTIAGAFLGGPIGAAIGGAIGGLVNRAFGRKAKENGDAGIEGVITGGGATGQAFQEWLQKGGTFRSDKRGTDRAAISSELDALLDGGAKAVLDQTKMWAATLGLPADALASVTSKFRVKLTGDAAADEAAISEMMQAYQAALGQKFAVAVSSLRKTGESVVDALARLSALTQFSEALNTFGGVFSRIASASIGARENLIGLAGGIEALAAKSAQFVADYYTQDEQAGLQAVAVSDALRAIGLDGSDLGSKADFRALVESLGSYVENTAAQQQLIGLLNIGPEFAKLGDYLAEQGKTLGQAAADAPQVALLERVMSQSEIARNQADNTKATADGVSALRTDVAGLREDTRAGLASVALYNSKMSRLLDSWDSGGRMLVALA